MTYSRFASLPRQQALETLSLRILNNFVVTEKIIRYCKEQGFSSYRLSSTLTPVLNHPSVNLNLHDLPNYSSIAAALDSIAKAVRETRLKISAHPSEYISLTSPDQSVIDNSFRDLASHAELFDLIGLPQSYEAPLNIHCRQEGDAETVSSDFLRNYSKLPDNVRSRLVIEVNDNKEGIWSIKNLYKYFYQKARIPVTFDNLHHSFCNHGVPEREAFDMAYSTWNTDPVFHYSEGIDGTRKHADYAVSKPPSYNNNVFWDVELKAKDLAIKKMFNSAHCSL